MMPPMDNGWPRTILTGLCIATCTLLGLFAARFSIDARGISAPALLDASVPAVATLMVLTLLALAAALAGAIARPINAVVALFCVGCAVAAFAARSGTVADAVFLGSSFRWLGAETIGWGLGVAVVATIMFRVGGPLPDVPSPEPSRGFGADLLRPRALAALLAAVVAPAVLAFALVGPAKGQSIGACTLAGVATAVAARLIAPREQPVLVFAAPVLTIGIAQLALAGSAVAGLDVAFAGGSLNPILCAMPSDAAAGALCGVAIGLGWTKGLVKPVEQAA